MTFSYDATTVPMLPKDGVRLLVNDTSSKDHLLEDEEIENIILLYHASLSGKVNIFRAAAAAANTMAMEFARQAFWQRDGDVQTRTEQRAKYYQDLAAELRRQAAVTGGGVPFAGGISIGQKVTTEQDSDRVRPIFTRDMMTAPGTPTGAEESAAGQLSAIPGVLP